MQIKIRLYRWTAAIVAFVNILTFSACSNQVTPGSEQSSTPSTGIHSTPGKTSETITQLPSGETTSESSHFSEPSSGASVQSGSHTNSQSTLSTSKTTAQTTSGYSQKFRDFFSNISFANPIPRLKTANPAKSPVVISVPPSTPRWQRYMLSAFQGLANRKEARLFLNWETSDSIWMSRWKSTDLYGFTPSNRSSSNVYDMIINDVDYYNVRGLLIYDDAVINQEIWSTILHVYTGICAVENLIPVPKSQRGDFPGLNVVFDATTGGKAMGRWANETEAYRWVVDNYPSLTRAGAPMAVQHPSCLREVDYYVMNQILPIYYWSGCPQSIKDIYNEIFLKTGPNGFVVGTWDIPSHSNEHSAQRDKPAMGNSLSFVPARSDGESDGPEHILVYLLSGYGKALLTTAEKGVQNMSFHEGLPLKPSKPVQQPTIPAYNASKKYMALHVSDGDNMCYINEAYDTTYGLTTSRWWGQSERGTVDISWSVAPGAVDLLPGVVSYLFDTSTANDSFIGAVSGWGYTMIRAYGKLLPSSTRNSELAKFYKTTGEYQKKLGVTSQHAIWSYLKDYSQNRSAELADMTIAVNAIKSVHPSFNGFFMEYGTNQKRNIPAKYFVDSAGGVPLFNAVNNIGDHLDNASNLTAAVNGLNSIPDANSRFMHVFCANWFVRPGSLKALCDRLGPNYIAVSANHLGKLYR